jgi:hypothetical protein
MWPLHIHMHIWSNGWHILLSLNCCRVLLAYKLKNLSDCSTCQTWKMYVNNELSSLSAYLYSKLNMIKIYFKSWSNSIILSCMMVSDSTTVVTVGWLSPLTNFWDPIYSKYYQKIGFELRKHSNLTTANIW